MKNIKNIFSYIIILIIAIFLIISIINQNKISDKELYLPNIVIEDEYKNILEFR